jgi:hypothetical protein
MSSNAVISAIRRAQALAHEIKSEGREATPKELATLEQAAELAERVVIDEQIKSFGEAGAPAQNQVSVAWSDPGSMFIRSEGYTRIKDSSSRGQQWTSGPAEVSTIPMEMKGTLLEGVGAPGSGTGGGAIPVPQVVPGVVAKLFQPLVQEDLLSSGQATTSTVRYAVEGTSLSGAQGVAEGGTKAESTLAFSTVDERVKKVATSTPVALVSMVRVDCCANSCAEDSTQARSKPLPRSCST